MALFGKVKKASDRKNFVDLLRHVVDGTKGEAGYALAPKAFVEQAMNFEPGLIGFNPQVAPDAQGNVQVKASANGIAAYEASLSGKPAASVSSDAASAASKYVLEQGIPVPVIKRGGLRPSEYPFETMPVGDSFFIAATEDNPNPAKSLGSTISSANKRYATVFPATKGKNEDGTPKAHPKAGQTTGKDGRKFTVRPRTVADGEKANGARIWRIQ